MLSEQFSQSREPCVKCLTNGELWQDERQNAPAVRFSHPTAA